MIDPLQFTTFDVETGGAEDLFALQPFRMRTREAWINSAAIAYFVGGSPVAESIRQPTPIELADWLETQRGRVVVGWNVSFDIAWLLVLDELYPELAIREKVFAIHWVDGMLLYRHAINAPRYKEEGRMSLSLKEAVAVFYPAEAGYEEGINYSPVTEEEWAELLTYNERDCKFTLRIAAHLMGVLPRRVIRAAMIEARALPLVADTKVEGLRVNVEKATALSETLEARGNTAQVLLAFEEGMRDWDKIIASPKQLGDLLYEEWGLPVPHLTKTGAPSTDKEAMAMLALMDPRAEKLQTVRDCRNRRTKFAVGALNSVAYNGDGYTRPDCRIFGTYTGRCTYSSKQGKGVNEKPTGVAIHQWKNDPEYRCLIEVDEDSELIEADFSGQEFRWMAVESEDEVMLDLCRPGEDPHAFMGHRIQPGLTYAWIRANKEEDPIAKQARKLGKVGNLSAQYRTGAKTLTKVAAVQHGVRLAVPEALHVIRAYKKTYRMVPAYWNRQIEFAMLNGYVQTLAGRRVNLGEFKRWRFVDPDGDYHDDVWSHESTAINFPIQGVGADQKYLALQAARNFLPQMGGRFQMELHDGIFFRVPKGTGEKAAREIKQRLSNLPYEKAWNLKRPLPTHFPVDVKVGPHWGALKELH